METRNQSVGWSIFLLRGLLEVSLFWVLIHTQIGFANGDPQLRQPDKH